MTLSVRLLAAPGRTQITANGRSYPVSNGVADLPHQDAESVGQDQGMRLAFVGTTAERPANDPNRVNWPPKMMYDSTLAAMVFLVPNSFPARWVTIDGSAA